MRVWTIQTADVLATLREGQIWRAHRDHAPEFWRRSYRWMAREMRTRLGPPLEPGQTPVWCWCAWRGAKQPRPDLRSPRHLPTGTPGVRLELEVEDARLLRSDFELWHYVLNGQYLPSSLADEREFDLHPDGGRVEPSWHRIFDLAWRNRRYTSGLAEKPIQAVMWELRPSDVRDVTEFIAR